MSCSVDACITAERGHLGDIVEIRHTDGWWTVALSLDEWRRYVAAVRDNPPDSRAVTDLHNDNAAVMLPFNTTISGDSKAITAWCTVAEFRAFRWDIATGRYDHITEEGTL